MIIIIYSPLMFNQRKFNKSLLQLNYLIHFMMITQSTNITPVIYILENLNVNGDILSQFKETNDLEKGYQSKTK